VKSLNLRNLHNLHISFPDVYSKLRTNLQRIASILDDGDFSNYLETHTDVLDEFDDELDTSSPSLVPEQPTDAEDDNEPTTSGLRVEIYLDTEFQLDHYLPYISAQALFKVFHKRDLLREYKVIIIDKQLESTLDPLLLELFKVQSNCLIFF
jgi:hypothetical protein